MALRQPVERGYTLGVGHLAYLEELYLWDNRLSGEIPAELGNLSNLKGLGIRGNELSGCVPASLKGQLDMSRTDLGDLFFCGDTSPIAPSASERAALMALYHATDGPNWKDNDHWLTAAPIGLWHGVTTDASGHVTELNLSSNQLTGAIPSWLGNLSNLAELWLSNNQLTGAIPSSLGNLSNLTYLGLGGNQLTGAIPSSLGNLSNLTYLGLGGNQLTGAIPSSLGSLSNLTYLGLGGNQLTGAIPSSLGNLSNLTVLSLNDNQLTGKIPAELGGLENLEVLYLSGNQLTGCVPAALRDVAENDFARLGLPFCALVPPATATRSFSATTVAPGGEITVNISLSEYGEGGSVTETLPEGFTFVSGSIELVGGEGFARPSGNVVNVVLAGAGVTNVIYKVTAPSEAGGPFKFTGSFVNFDGESVDIGGASTVTVAADAGTPASYDSNGNGIIELSELFVAIDDYFAGKISLTVLFDIIDFYFSGDRVG